MFPSVSPRPAGTKWRILVVEDERLVAREIQLRLIDLGYDVPVTVASSDEAIAQVTHHCPDLVLMDIRIEGDRDGIEVAEVLRTRWDLPIVFLTAHSDDATIARAKATDPSGYILKPLKPGELRGAVEIALYKHEMSRQLRVREQWLSTTLRSIGDAVVSTDAFGVVTFMNSVAETLTGWRSGQAIGRPLTEVLHLVGADDPDGVENPIVQALTTGSVVRLDHVILAQNGQRVVIADSVAPIVDEAGAILGGVVVFRDVTEQRRMQRQLELADRLASLGTMVSGMSHEVNTPLAVTLANTQLVLEALKDRVGEGAWVSELIPMLTQAVDGATRVKAIVSDMKAFASLPATSKVQCDVAEVIARAVEIVSRSARDVAAIAVDVAASLKAAADGSRLTQVVVHLLRNAVQSFVAQAATNLVRITARVDPRGIAIEVSDNGSGITEELRARIFEPFFTTRQPGDGMGLGLSICHGLVASFGGLIELDASTSRGSTFRVLVPGRDETLQAITTSEVAPAGTFGRILLVDDEPTLLGTLARALKRQHQVETAGDGRDAIAMLEAGERFDVIVCDLMMPAVSGIDVFEWCAASLPEQARRIVFLTGGAFSARSSEFLHTTTQPVFAKPFDVKRLRSELKHLISSWGLFGTAAET